MAKNTLLKCKGLCFSYSQGPLVLKNADFSLSQGGFAVIQGPSGCGKSTFLRLLNRLELPDSGTIEFRQKPIEDLSPPELRSSIIYLQQTPSLAPGTVRKNLLLPFGFEANSLKTPPDNKKMEQGLASMGLEDIALNKAANGLSVGQKQRLCLLRALLLAPSILLLDEPVSALDRESRIVVEQVVHDYCEKKELSVILVSHVNFSLSGLAHKHFSLYKGVLEEQI